MSVVLRLDDGDGKVRFVIKQVIRLLRLTAPDRLATDHHPTFGEVGFLPNLGHQIPARSLRTAQGRSDELGTDVGFGKRLLETRATRQAEALAAARTGAARGSSARGPAGPVGPAASVAPDAAPVVEGGQA